MADLTWPVTPGTRQVRWRILLNGTPLAGCETVDVHSTNHRKASTIHATFALKADPSALATWADADPPVGLEVQASIRATGGQVAWTSVFVGDASEISIDPVRGTVDVGGRDLAGRLIDAKTRETFRNQKGSEIAATVAARFGLSADVDATDTPAGAYYQLEHDKLTQDSLSKSTTYWDLLCFLARYDDRDLWVEGRTLHYKVAVDLASAQAVPLAWTPPAAGTGYAVAPLVDIHLKRSLTLAKGIKVVVKTWGAKAKKATAVTFPGSSSKDAQEYVFVRPNMSPKDALTFAQAMYADIIRHEREVTVELPGSLSLTPRSVIEVSGLPGTTYNTRYAVDEMTHSFMPGNAVRTTISLKNHSVQSGAEVS